MKRPRWFWLSLYVFALLAVATTGFVAYRVYKSEQKERQEREVLAGLSLDELRFSEGMLRAKLYNPKPEGFEGPVDWHVQINDPRLRTHFERVFRGYLNIGPHQSMRADVLAEFPNGTSGDLSATIEWVQR